MTPTLCTRPTDKRSRSSRGGEVYVVSATGGTPTRLSSDAGSIEGLAWTPDSHHIVYSTDARMWSVCATGGEPLPVEALEGGALTLTTGPDNQLVYAFDGDLSLARPTSSE